ncbi:hypothetical protein HDU97_002355 [Phlyctochytrium planicorne]|nr:hypothetical protein HDU97_002355 [Phlyctochytrium planicorne]
MSEREPIFILSDDDDDGVHPSPPRSSSSCYHQQHHLTSPIDVKPNIRELTPVPFDEAYFQLERHPRPYASTNIISSTASSFTPSSSTSWSSKSHPLPRQQQQQQQKQKQQSQTNGLTHGRNNNTNTISNSNDTQTHLLQQILGRLTHLESTHKVQTSHLAHLLDQMQTHATSQTTLQENFDAFTVTHKARSKAHEEHLRKSIKDMESKERERREMWKEKLKSVVAIERKFMNGVKEVDAKMEQMEKDFKMQTERMDKRVHLLNLEIMELRGTLDSQSRSDHGSYGQISRPNSPDLGDRTPSPSRPNSPDLGDRTPSPSPPSPHPVTSPIKADPNPTKNDRHEYPYSDPFEIVLSCDSDPEPSPTAPSSPSLSSCNPKEPTRDGPKPTRTQPKRQSSSQPAQPIPTPKPKPRKPRNANKPNPSVPKSLPRPAIPRVPSLKRPFPAPKDTLAKKGHFARNPLGNDSDGSEMLEHGGEDEEVEEVEVGREPKRGRRTVKDILRTPLVRHDSVGSGGGHLRIG